MAAALAVGATVIALVVTPGLLGDGCWMCGSLGVVRLCTPRRVSRGWNDSEDLFQHVSQPGCSQSQFHSGCSWSLIIFRMAMIEVPI